MIAHPDLYLDDENLNVSSTLPVAADERRFDRVAVVVPAYNEAATIGACLTSIAVAAAACPLPVEIVVVADSCDDATAAIAAAAGARVVEVQERNVGRVRAAGCRAAMRNGPEGLWLANTDADSTVPPDWLTRQLAYATDGADMVAGVVGINGWAAWPPDVQARYEAYYAEAIRAGRHHIHGCNLGVSAAGYQTAGGFPPLLVGEDHALLMGARKVGLTIVHATDLAVTTSSRRHARVTGGGFHAFLSVMAAD